MKTLILSLLLVVAFVLVKRAMAGPSISAAEADERVKAATAVLIDVREPDEWTEGVAAPAASAIGARRDCPCGNPEP